MRKIVTGIRRGLTKEDIFDHLRKNINSRLMSQDEKEKQQCSYLLKEQSYINQDDVYFIIKTNIECISKEEFEKLKAEGDKK